MQQVSGTATYHATGGTCLIIEDSSFDSERLARVVKKYQRNMRIEQATTLQSARRALRTNAANLILLDNNLPDGLGANFALELASDEQLSTIPVILISDWPSPFMWEKAARAGVRYVLSKSEFEPRYVHAALAGEGPAQAM